MSGGSFHAASNVLMLTGGGPEDATNIIGIEIFKRAFLYLQFGYATANSTSSTESISGRQSLLDNFSVVIRGNR